MAVQFIIGRSGTGKTSYCIEAIVNALLERADERRLILLVPEQASYQAERAILSDKRIAGYHRLQVLSFDRLQFLLSGRHTTRPGLSRIGQQMVVHRILRDNKDNLRIFGSSAGWPGLSRRMAETITELHRYAKGPDDIEQLLSELQAEPHNRLTIRKFSDVGLVLKEYLDFIEGRFIDPDIQLTRACGKVADAGFVKGARLWVDGFASFTVSELAILVELLRAVAEAQIALCLDPANIDLQNPNAEGPAADGLFNPTHRTYIELVERVKRCKLQLARPIILREAIRFSGCPQLAHVERNIFKSNTERLCCEDKIRIISAPNARAEVRFVAREILHLVRDKGYRFRDIAVIASDLEAYEHYIRAYFEDYGIAFFIDKRKPLNQHPVVALVCLALQVISGGFRDQDIFAYLKTDLVPADRGDIDLIENYCVALGIDGADWQSEEGWHFAAEDAGFDEGRINQIRQKVVGPLLELRDGLCPAEGSLKMLSPREFTRAVFSFLDSLSVRQRLARWIEQAVRSKDYTSVQEHQQSYDKLINIFDELVEVFGGQRMSCQDYLAILSSAFSQMTLAFIPPSLDQVLVGAIERSRHPELKAVFLMGCTQRRFPAAVNFESILTEDDRRAAQSANFQLAPAMRQVLAERRYLAYIAFTRASEFLCVTYPAVDDKASAVARSEFVDNLEVLFEDLQEEEIPGEQTGMDKLYSETELTDLLSSGLGKEAVLFEAGDNGQLSSLLDDICGDEQFGELGGRVVFAINYDNRARLDKDMVERLFGRHIRSSATRISTFAACPYRYFARYILQLEKRKEFKLEPLDLGRFYHQVLDAWLKRLCGEKKDLGTIEDGQLVKLLTEEIGKLVQGHRFISNFAARGAHNAFIVQSAGDTLKDCVLAIARMVRAGSFRPIMSEVSFGQVKDSPAALGEYRIRLSDNRWLFLDGKIDRLDIADVGGQKVVTVFDYKRREASFNWSKFYYGLDMQLPIYMLAVRDCSRDPGVEGPVTVAGAFYMPVEAPPRQANPGESLPKTESYNYKAKGIFNGAFARHLDGITASGWSKFYTFRVAAKDQQYGDYGRSSALRPNDFERVLKFTERKLVQLAGEMLSGRIDITPYRISTDWPSPCSYCEYKPVCRFDWQINDYRFLESLSKLKVFERMERLDG